MVLCDGHCSGEAIGTVPAVRYVAFFVWVVVVDEEPAYGALSCVARYVVRCAAQPQCSGIIRRWKPGRQVFCVVLVRTQNLILDYIENNQDTSLINCTMIFLGANLLTRQ